jgi:hypothetical protein
MSQKLEKEITSIIGVKIVIEVTGVNMIYTQLLTTCFTAQQNVENQD